VIQLQILSGKQAGRDIVARRFPFVIGRAPNTDLQLDEPGVWDRHFRIRLERGQGFGFDAQTESLVLLNGERVEEGFLRNGDVIDLGSTRLRFWLARARQKTLRVREALTWLGLGLLFAAQIALVWLLLR
jgi:pSer/pThr/pTyr-binding forkhead associated (FHA) protein